MPQIKRVLLAVVTVILDNLCFSEAPLPDGCELQLVPFPLPLRIHRTYVLIEVLFSYMSLFTDDEQTDLALDTVVGLALQTPHGSDAFFLVLVLCFLFLDLLV